MRHIVLYFFLAGILSLTACTDKSTTKLTVSSSIKPIHAIVFAIAGDNTIAHQLIPDSASPHSYTFKPSDMRKIADSDIIFRIDEHFESMLNSALNNTEKVISLADNPAIHLLPLVNDHGHSPEHGAIDMHIFTSPENAITMAQEIEKTLSNLDPKNTTNYQQNLQQFSQKVTQTSSNIKAKLKLVNKVPYVVFHNSWQYFGEYFGLQKPEIIHLQEGMTAGAKTITTIREKIASQGIHCIFSDPSITPRRIETLTEGMTIKSAKIDVLAQQFTINKDTYIQWLGHIGEQVKNCLKQ